MLLYGKTIQNLNAKSASFLLTPPATKKPVLLLAYSSLRFVSVDLILQPGKAELVLGSGGSHMQGRKKEVVLPIAEQLYSGYAHHSSYAAAESRRRHSMHLIPVSSTALSISSVGL
jgi:hypothetical protein